jgi:hypothetical protein
LWCVCGVFVVCLWCVCGVFVVCLWCICGVFVVCLWGWNDCVLERFNGVDWMHVNALFSFFRECSPDGLAGLVLFHQLKGRTKPCLWRSMSLCAHSNLCGVCLMVALAFSGCTLSR